MILVDVIICVVIATAVGFVVAKMIRDKKAGKVGGCGCGCNCSSCNCCGSAERNRSAK